MAKIGKITLLVMICTGVITVQQADAQGGSPCDSGPCKNGGNCFLVTGNVAACSCLDAYTGVRCEFARVCFPINPCFNGGTCSVTSDSPTVAVCACTSDFTGTVCDIPVACFGDNNPCLNGGTCSVTSDSPDVAVCACPAGFTGRRCESGLCPYNPETQVCCGCQIKRNKRLGCCGDRFYKKRSQCCKNGKVRGKRSCRW